MAKKKIVLNEKGLLGAVTRRNKRNQSILDEIDNPGGSRKAKIEENKQKGTRKAYDVDYQEKG